MARKSNLEWDWDNDAPLSSVGGQVFLKELSQEEVKARHAEVRSKLKGGVGAVMMVNETMAKSDHRGQDALQHFRAGVHSVEISNETIAKSDGRGQRAIRHLKAAKNAIALTKDSVAYMQVKDLTKNQNEQVFIFNGWTFASNPSLTPFDHAIYDLQLLNCSNA